MRRIVTVLSLSAALAAAAPTAVAGEPTCSEVFGGRPHGYHVVADYVTGIGSELLGGPGIEWPPSGLNAGGGAAHPGGPYHGGAIGAGASFCNSQSQSPGFHLP